jgi:hypothetical protein
MNRDEPRDYVIPEGCLCCGADLPVRVSERGPMGVCVRCGWFGRPTLTVTHRELKIDYEPARA